MIVKLIYSGVDGMAAQCLVDWIEEKIASKYPVICQSCGAEIENLSPLRFVDKMEVEE